MNQNTRIRALRLLKGHPTKISKFRLESPIECKYSKCRFRCKTTEELEKHIERTERPYAKARREAPTGYTIVNPHGFVEEDE